MDGEQKFWVSVWVLVAFTVVTVLCGALGTSAYRARVLERMVSEQHIDPMRAACALDIGDRKEGVCAILAAH